MRRFHLHRMKDETGKSGVGIVAEGLVFTDGTTILRWMSATPSTLIFASQEQMEKILIAELSLERIFISFLTIK